MRHFLYITYIAFLGCTWLNLLGAAQEQVRSPRNASVEVFSTLDGIQVKLLVRDSEGNLIRNLSAEDLIVFENGSVRKIISLQRQQVPIHALVMADTSQSLKTYLQDALSVAMDFFEGFERKRAFVLFDEEPRVLVDWQEQRIQGLSAQLTDVQADRKTAMHDSVIWAARTKFQGISGKKLILLITDGIDTASQSTLEDMMRVTREEGITLYSVIPTNAVLRRYQQNFKYPEFRCPAWVSTHFHNFMMQQAKFANFTMHFGGRTIFSDRFLDLKSIYQNIIDEMKSYYVLVYESKNLPDEERQIAIRTRNRTGQIFVEISQ